MIPKGFLVHRVVSQALREDFPVVALESAVITHGLPTPHNLYAANQMEGQIRIVGAIPATICMLDGDVRVGLDQIEIELLADRKDCHKIGMREISTGRGLGWNGGTTVSGTIFIADKVGIKVIATGGIGGVHRYPGYDISADLHTLARTPVIVVCSGAKNILDLPATLEFLETVSVPIIGYQTDHFPAFLTRDSGLSIPVTVNSVGEVSSIARHHWDLGIPSAILVVVPPPEDYALLAEDIEDIITTVVEDAYEMGITGQAVTPYILDQVQKQTGGASLRANISLLSNNARIAAEIAVNLVH